MWSIYLPVTCDYHHCCSYSNDLGTIATLKSEKGNEMKNFKIATVTTLVMIALSGCVANKAPTTSDFMRMHALDEKAASDDQKAMAKEWDRGSKLKLSGEEMIKDGEKLEKSGDHDMTIGKQNIEQGNKDITEGTKIMDESERTFEEKYPNLKLDLNR